MKAFIEKMFKPKKLKKEKEVETTEAKVEAIIEEVKEVIKKEEVKKEEVKKEEVVTYPKPNHFPDCTCFKCDRWKQQNAK
jgi:hypothetical protein